MGRRTLVQAGGIAAIALVDADLRIGAGIFGQQPKVGSQYVGTDLLHFEPGAELVERIAKGQRLHTQEGAVLQEAAVLLDEVVIPDAGYARHGSDLSRVRPPVHLAFGHETSVVSGLSLLFSQEAVIIQDVIPILVRKEYGEVESFVAEAVCDAAEEGRHRVAHDHTVGGEQGDIWIVSGRIGGFRRPFGRQNCLSLDPRTAACTAKRST